MRNSKTQTSSVPDSHANFSQAPKTLAPALVEGVGYMTKCLKCAAEIADPLKEWDIKTKSGRGAALHIRLFQCPSCGHKFRVTLKAN